MPRILLQATLLLFAVSDLALATVGARTACPGGRFMADAPLVARDATGQAGEVNLVGGQVRIGTTCGAVRAAMKRTRHGTLVRAAWPPCGGLTGRVRMRAMIRPGCATLVGVVRARHHRQRFVANRQPDCGNGILEGQEECDANGCCTADCRVSADPSCPGDRACTTDADCTTDATTAAFCARPAGECDAAGVCRSTGGVCTADVDPVCGCDGKTYSSACDAAAHGVNVASPGPCDAPPCGTIAGLACGEGQVCELLPGECHVADAAGRCVDVPATCLGILDPVCGCDGHTWVNDCFRRQAGVPKAHDGDCHCLDVLCSPDTKPVDTDGDGCPDQCGRVCDEPCDCLRDPALPLRPCPGGCDPTGACGAFWTCEDHVCVERCGPLPGDGCAPPPPTPCASNDDCTSDSASGAFCDAPPGDCEGPGTCAPRPAACPDVFRPVCGCDGITYGNGCDAAAHGVRIAHEGPCQCAPPPCNALDRAVDTNGDGCPDTCVRACRETCDCYDHAPPFSEPCPLACATCGDFWTCEDGLCTEHCGPIPPGNDECHLPPGPCTTNDACAPGEYCAAAAPGTCDGEGVCVARPEVCTRELDPVCGCDGRTYSNACLAAAAGTRVAATGPCPCHDVTCPDGTVGVDTDGDGCTDRCPRPCTEPCDCGPLPLGGSDVCPLASLCPAPFCGRYWTCDGGYCIDHCGVIPPGDVCPLGG